MPDARRPGPADPAGERGLSLIELLVAMALFTGLLAAVYGVLISVQRQSVDLQARETSVGDARLAVQSMDRQIRSGNVLADPAAETLPRSLRVYTQADGDPRCVQWQVDTGAGTLRTRSWSTTWSTDGDVEPWGVLARGLVDPRSPTTPYTPFALSAASSAYGSRLVDIRLLVQPAGSVAAPLEVQTSLSGRNTQYGYDRGTCSPVPAA